MVVVQDVAAAVVMVKRFVAHPKARLFDGEEVVAALQCVMLH